MGVGRKDFVATARAAACARNLVISAALELAPRRRSSLRSLDELRRAAVAREAVPLTSVGRGVWIYGAGGFGRMLARALDGAGLRTLGFIDRKAAPGAQVDGRPCIHPDDVTADVAQGACYLHGLFNHYFSSRDIVDWAATKPFDRLLFASDVNRIPGVMLSSYWLAPAGQTLADMPAVERALDAFDDDESHRLFLDLLNYRLDNDPRLHPRVDRDDIYAPDFLPIRREPITLVDGGAYTGDSLEGLLSHGVRVKDWIAFEPDARNLEGLRETAHRLADGIGAFTISPYGLSDRNGRVGFASDEGEASHVVENPGPDFSGTTIEVARLDDVVARQGPVYVKLDIEGAEQAALRGMERMFRPGNVFAVSVYHRPADLWEIPLMLRERLPGCRLGLRQHGHHGFDTVVYAWTD